MLFFKRTVDCPLASFCTETEVIRVY